MLKNRLRDLSEPVMLY